MFLVGSYSCLAMVFNSAGVRLESGVPSAPFAEPNAKHRRPRVLVAAGMIAG